MLNRKNKRRLVSFLATALGLPLDVGITTENFIEARVEYKQRRIDTIALLMELLHAEAVLGGTIHKLEFYWIVWYHAHEGVTERFTLNNI